MAHTAWSVTEDQCMAAPGAAFLLYHEFYPEGKQGGLELIHHGKRIATCGEIRPDPRHARAEGHAILQERTALEGGGLRADLYDSTLRLHYRISLAPAGDSVRVGVDLARPLESTNRMAPGFCLELYPPAFWGKTFHLGEACGVFPREPNRPIAADRLGRTRATPMARGNRLVIAPEDPQRSLTIEATLGEIVLFDGRKGDEEAWFTVCTPLEPGSASRAIEWLVTPHRIEGWRRPPMVALSQAGYHPEQAKRAVIELDQNAEGAPQVRLLRISPQGGLSEVLSGEPHLWGDWLCYQYAIFDFTDVREPGLYSLDCDGRQAGPFRIGDDVYRYGVWQPTLESFFPVQMCHAEVWDGLRLWHAACHLDDALQAPTRHVHVDGYAQGPATDTQFEPYQHIPHLDLGGWHDAGDTDLAAGSQAQTVHALALAREEFGVDSDQTTVVPHRRLVRMHTPDGEADILQQIAWGVHCLLGGYRAAGHSFCGIIAGDTRRFYMRGELSSMTDNLIYDDALGPDERTGERSGQRDDRWAFTNRDTSLEYRVAAALAAASRVLGGYRDELARECLQAARKAWEYEHSHETVRHRSGYVPGKPRQQEVLAAAELLAATGEEAYGQRLLELLPVIRENPGYTAWAAARALPYVEETRFRQGLRDAAQSYARELEESVATNPFGILWEPNIWGVGWQIQHFALRHYYLVRTFPDLFDREQVLRVVNYVLGCHPDNNLSLTSGIGARSVTTAFGVNRSDWHHIPGGMVSGVNLVRPNFPELKVDYPFLWQQSEYVMPGAATYIFCVLAADALLRSD